MGHVTIWALEKINPEWIAAKELATQPITAGSCDCDIYIRYELPCRHYLLRACRQGFPIPLSLLHPRWRLNGPPIAPGNWQARYYDDSIYPDDANSTRYHDVSKNRFLHAAASLQKLHEELPRQQADLLANQLSTFHTNVTVTHEKLQEVSQGLSVTLPKPPPTRKEVWAELRQKKKHDRVNARALTAAEAAERDAKQRDKQKKKNSEAAKQRNKQKKNSEKNSETIASLSSNLSLFFASLFVIMTFKFRDRSKDSKNLTSITTTTTTTFNEPSLSFVSSVMTRTTKSDRAVKKTTV